MLHNLLGRNTDYVIYSGVCFAACLPATVLHDFAEEQVSNILNKLTWSNELYPKMLTQNLFLYSDCRYTYNLSTRNIYAN